MRSKIISAEAAASLVKNGEVVYIAGGKTNRLVEALGRRFKKTALPRKLSVIYTGGVNQPHAPGLDHLAYEGLIDTVVASHWSPRMANLALHDKIKAYNLPQGILSQMIRTAAAGEKGMIKKTGLYTFVDPRLEGARVNTKTESALVERLQILDEEFLFYRSLFHNVAFIRASSADVEGNLTMEDEPADYTSLSAAQVCRARSGLTIALVDKQLNSLARHTNVRVPSALVDFIVVDPNTSQPAMHGMDVSLHTDTPRNEKNAAATVQKLIAIHAFSRFPQQGFVHISHTLESYLLPCLDKLSTDPALTFVNENGQILRYFAKLKDKLHRKHQPTWLTKVNNSTLYTVAGWMLAFWIFFRSTSLAM